MFPDNVSAWRAIAPVMLGWLLFFFARTLLPGREALITRIARIGDPALPPQLCRYTRRLTAVWCAYFLAAAVFSVLGGQSPVVTGLMIWAGTIVLFVGEHWLRPLFFPGHPFPGLRQQLKDTLRAWPAFQRGGK